MKTIEAITEATNPTRANKTTTESLIEVSNKGEGTSKIIIGGNTKATVGNSTPHAESITIIITMVIIKVEVDEAVVVIITEVTVVVEAVTKAITITNTTNIRHMMIAHKWSNMNHHVHFVVVSITLLSIILRESMT